MTLASPVFLNIAKLLLSGDREQRDQACLDFRVIWPEMDLEEQTSLGILMAHVLHDESDRDIRGEELHALAQKALQGELSATARKIVEHRGIAGLDPSDLVSWEHIVRSH